MKNNVNSQNELSRQWMQLALIELLKTKDLDDITVSELTKKAGVARVTFYRNYVSLADIIFDYMKMQNFGLVPNSNPLSQYLPYFIRSYFIFFQDHLVLFKCIKKHALIDRLYSALTEQITNNAYMLISSYGFESPYEVSALVGMFSKILMDWLVSGMKESIEDMTMVVYNILTKFTCVMS